jgi:hypothetical protein
MSKNKPRPPAIKRSTIIWIAALAILGGVIAGFSVGWAPAKQHVDDPKIVVYREPSCLCCIKWIAYLEEHGFDVEERIEDDLAAVRKLHGVPKSVKSCHTSLVEGYVIEGHVPAEDIKRLLAEKPMVRGLAVPGMPGASPGMESYSPDRKPYDVLMFGPSGAVGTFATHPGSRFDSAP